MTPLSRWKLNNCEEEIVRKVLTTELARISDEQKMETLVNVLLTETEQLMIAKRIFAFILIDRGVDNMGIAKRLHFTRETVARLRSVYKHLDETQKPVKELVKSISNTDLVKKLIHKFIKSALPVALGRIPR